MRFLSTVLAAGLIAGLSSQAKAIPIAFDESIAGFDITSSTNFLLGIGANTISGNAGKPTFSSPSDFDLARINLPSDSFLSTIKIETTPVNGSIRNFGFFELATGSTLGGFGFAKVDLPSSGPFSATIAINQAFSETLVVGLNSLPPLVDTDYTFTLNVVADEPPLVSAVPEPSTLALFGLGLAGLSITRRRRAA